MRADLEDGKQMMEYALRGLDYPEAPVEGGLDICPGGDREAGILYSQQRVVAFKQLVDGAQHDGVHVHAHHAVVLRQCVCI